MKGFWAIVSLRVAVPHQAMRASENDTVLPHNVTVAKEHTTPHPKGSECRDGGSELRD